MKSLHIPALLLVLSAAVLLGTRHARADNESGYAHAIRIGEHPVQVDVAADSEAWARGLMFRREMPENAGMLFVFDTSEERSFWMRNTYIALDIIYFDAKARLLSIQSHVPPCRTQRCPSYPSHGKARFVVELNAGRAAALGLGPGSPLCALDTRVNELPACR